MGVPGLWDVLRPTSQARSLLDLAVKTGFIENNHECRAYKIGIDASIWFFHAQGGREGENPELRTLFFRCSRLLAMPFLPIFVFDGPKRPKIKRGKAIGGGEHWMINSLRTVLDAFGFECRTAPGEAEAELAYLNRIGVIDAVLSDDVDCFIFGAHTVIRNSSATLSGNRTHGARNIDGKEDGHHVYVYYHHHLRSNPDVSLTEGGLILIALLRGGDYDQRGVEGCGISTAHALARSGFGDTLLAAARNSNPDALSVLLPAWRKALRHELATNASGFAPRKSPTLAKRITDDFPSLDVLRCYTHPVTSECSSGSRGVDGLWRKHADVAKIARVCEKYFEWGMEETIIKRFRSFLWPGAVLRTLLHATLEKDKRRDPTASGAQDESPSKALTRTLGKIALSSDGDDNGFQLVIAIRGERRHISTDHLLEYRLEIDPRQLVAYARTGIQGTRVQTVDSAAVDISSEDEEGRGDCKKKTGGTKTAPPDPDSLLRVWMPAVMVECAYPDLVKNFVEGKSVKEAKKVGKKTGTATTPTKKAKKTRIATTPTKKVRDTRPQEEDERGLSTSAEPPTKPKEINMKTKPKTKPPRTYRLESEEGEVEPLIVQAKSKGKAKISSDQKAQLSTTLNLQAPLTKSSVQAFDHELIYPSHPFPTPTESKCKGEEEEDSKLIPRPFPMTIDDVFMRSALRLPPSLSHTRKHSTRLVSSANLDTDPSASSLKKIPPGTVDRLSPRKPRRPSSPSPSRPSITPKMRPLQRAIARSTASKPDAHNDDTIIVISSDSEEDIPLLKLKATTRPRVMNKIKEALSSDSNLDLDIIDLT